MDIYIIHIVVDVRFKLIQPLTHGFLHADIHELLLPDLLHQLIKGTFKDYYVTWVNEYLHVVHGETQVLEVIQDIDHQYEWKLKVLILC
jgi:hypothetical protein